MMKHVNLMNPNLAKIPMININIKLLNKSKLKLDNLK